MKAAGYTSPCIQVMLEENAYYHGKLKSDFEMHILFSGMDKLKFKPAYNPYTEPSMEIFRYKIMNSSYRCTACKVIGNLIRPIRASYHEGLKKWVEIGNSGMFRPEMLRPMGFSEDVNVIAWGLSLER